MSLLRSYLESNHILSTADLDGAARHLQAQGGSLDTALLELGLLTAADLDTHLAKACGLPTVPARLLETGPVRPWSLVPKALVDIGWAMPLAVEDGNVLVAVHPDLPDARLGQLYRQIRGFMPMVAPECCLAKLAAERSGGIVAPRHAMLLLDMLDALQGRATPPGAPASPEPRKQVELENTFREPPADSAAATVMLPVPAPDAAESLSATVIRPAATDDPSSSGSYPIASAFNAASSGTFATSHDSGSFPISNSGSFPDLRSVGAQSSRRGASPDTRAPSNERPAPTPPREPAPRSTGDLAPAPVPSNIPAAAASAPVPSNIPAAAASAPVPSDIHGGAHLAKTRPLPAAWETRGPIAAPGSAAQSPPSAVPSDSPPSIAPLAAPDEPRRASASEVDPGTSLSAPVLHDPGRAQRLAERMAPALATLTHARERDRITEAIVQAALHISPRVALFGVKREGLRALAAPGSALQLPTTLVIPIPDASLLERAVLGQIRLKLLTEPKLASAVGRPLGIPCLFEPVYAQDRGVLMLYIDRDGGLFDTADHAAARELCDLARGSLEALLRLMGLGTSARSAAAIVDSGLLHVKSGPSSVAPPQTSGASDPPAAEAATPSELGETPATAEAPTSEPPDATKPRARPETRDRANRTNKRQIIALVNPIRRDSAPSPAAEPLQASATPAPSDSPPAPAPSDSPPAPAPSDSPPAAPPEAPPPSVLHVPNLVAPGSRRISRKGERPRGSNEGLVMPTDLRRSATPASTTTTLSMPASLIAPAPLPGAKRRGSKTGLHPIPPSADEITLNMPRLVRSEAHGGPSSLPAPTSPAPAPATETAATADLSAAPAAPTDDGGPATTVTADPSPDLRPAPITAPTASEATPPDASEAPAATHDLPSEPATTDLSSEPATTDLSSEPAASDLSPGTSPASEPASPHPGDPTAGAASEDSDAAIEAYLQAPQDPGALARLRAFNDEGLARLAARFPGPIDPGSASDVRSFPPPSAHGPLLRACVEIGPTLTPFILPLVDHPRPQIRFYAAFLFQDLRDPRCMRPLAAHAFDPDPDVRLIATRVLESYNRVAGFVEATDLVRAELKSKDRERALLASEAAGTLRDTRAVAVLIDILSVRDKQLRETALESLCSITAKHHGYRPAKWKAWYAEHGQQTRVEWVLDALRHRDTAVRRWASDELVRITGHRISPPQGGEKPTAKYVLQQWTAWWEAHASELGER